MIWLLGASAGVAAGIWLSLNPASGAAAAVLASGCLAATLVLRADRDAKPWLPGATALAVMTFSFPLGSGVSLLALLLLAGLMTHRVLAALNASEAVDGRRRLVILLVLLVLAYWLLTLFNPNVPRLRVGLLGLRKSMFVFVALALGAAWPRDRRLSRTCDYIWALLLASMMVSIMVHLAAPTVELSFARSADVYTEEYAGSPRLQGIFAGPFHVSMAASFLVIAGLYRVSRMAGHPRALPLLSFAVGLVSLYLAQVRTGYLVTLVGILLLLARSPRRGRGRALALVLTVVIGAVLWVTASPRGISGLDPAAASLGGLSTDSRALGRVGTWRDAWHLFSTSPFVGWGAGSAGDTLDPYFVGHQHVTAHDVLLKYMVEGGTAGLLLILACIAAVISARRSPSPWWSLGMPASVALLGFSVTGAGVEAIPVSVLLALLVGLSLGSDPQTAVRRQPHSAPALSKADRPTGPSLSSARRPPHGRLPWRWDPGASSPPR